MNRTDEPCTIFVRACTVHQSCLFLPLLVFEFKLLAASVPCGRNPAPSLCSWLLSQSAV